MGEGEKEGGRWGKEGGQQGSCSLLASLCCGSLGCEERMYFRFLSVHVQRASLPTHLNSLLNSNLSPAERHRQKYCYYT